MVEAFMQQLKELADRLKEMDPDPSRDWLQQRDALDQVQANLTAALDQASTALAEVEPAEERATLRGGAANLTSSAAALLVAAGRPSQVRGLLSRLRAIAEGTSESGIVAALEGSPDDVVRLNRAWWLFRQKRRAEAQQLAKGLTSSNVASIAEEARSILQAPTPISGPPVLFTLNGCGVRIYGERDRSQDGSYVTTRFITFLFVPVMPLDAFRVVPAEEAGSYYFLGKVALGRAARAFRWAAAAALALLIGVPAVQGYLSSPTYRLSRAFKEVSAAERAARTDGERARVLARYEQLAHDYSGAGGAELAATAEAVVRMSAATLPQPLRLDDLNAARQVVQRFRRLPVAARGGGGAESLVQRIEAWADALGDRDPEHLEGSLRLLDDAIDLSGSAGGRARVERRRTELRRQLGARLADEWPLEAITTYVALGADAGALRAAGQLLDRLPPGPSVWRELGGTIATWEENRRRAGLADLDPLARRLLDRVTQANREAAAPGRAALLEGGDARALAAALTRTPGDQELASTLVDVQRQNGKLREALATLQALGKPGLLVRRAQLALASVYRDLDRLEPAEHLLDRQLAMRLPAYESIARLYLEALAARRAQLVAELRGPSVDPRLAARVNAASEEERNKILGEWMAKKLEGDPHLQQLQEQHQRHLDVVPAALTLGTIKLRRASQVGGPRRKRLLDHAEHVFLAIHSEAEGVPTLHLALGQVYHRLGKTKEGEQEFSQLLAQKAPRLSLAAAAAYREIGLPGRATEVAKTIFAEESSPHREEAATLLGAMASRPDEREAWFRKADPKNPFVQVSLLDLEADRARSDGKLDLAQRKYAAVAEHYLKDATRSSAAANNAALAMGARFGCTGDLRHLDGAISAHETAMRLQPDSPLVLDNSISSLELRLRLGVLSRWVKLDVLTLADESSRDLVASLLAGPLAGEVRKALAGDSRLRRILELSQQAEVLAPRSPHAYTTELRLLADMEDADGLRRLRDRVDRLQRFDTSQYDEARASWLSGKLDDQSRRALRSKVERLEQQIAAARRAGHKPTLASALLLRGDAVIESATLEARAESARAAVQAFQEADREWPPGGASSHLPRAMVTQAVLEGPETAKAWKQDGRRFTIAAFLHHLLATRNLAALTELRQNATLRRAAALCKSGPAERRSALDWVLGKLTEDQTLVEAVRPRLKRPASRLSAELELQLDPGSESSRETLAMVKEAE